MKTISLTQARNQLLQLAEEIDRNPALIVKVVKRGSGIMTLMSTELHESLVETLEVLSEENTAAKLRLALKEIQEGRGIPWKEARKRLRVKE
jgi:PHD/YefM family antitoxin component YafN of YafNO toxin-antitoxin module